MSPSRQLFKSPQTYGSWQDAANQAFGEQLKPMGQLPDRPQSATVSGNALQQQSHRPVSAQAAMRTGANEGIMDERPVSSSSSTQTDTSDFAELGDRLVQALNKEDALKAQRGHLGKFVTLFTGA